MFKTLIIDDIKPVILVYYYDMLGGLQFKTIDYLKSYEVWCRLGRYTSTKVPTKFYPYYFKILKNHVEALGYE